MVDELPTSTGFFARFLTHPICHLYGLQISTARRSASGESQRRHRMKPWCFEGRGTKIHMQSSHFASNLYYCKWHERYSNLEKSSLKVLDDDDDDDDEEEEEEDEEEEEEHATQLKHIWQLANLP